MSHSTVEAAPFGDVPLSLGNGVLEANEIHDAAAVVTGNYVNPDHALPLPYPQGDWYLRQTMVPALRSGETVIAHTLIPGLADYYRDVGLLPQDATVIEVDPQKNGSNSFGFPYTDPLEVLRGSRQFDGQYLCPTFNGAFVEAQAKDLNLRTLDRAESTLSNHKSRLREAADEYGFRVLPGMALSHPKDMQIAGEAEWNTEHGAWLKFPTGSGGDLVIRIKEQVTPGVLEAAVAKLRRNIGKAFAEGTFEAAFDDFWPESAVAPEGFPLVLEADAHTVGDVVANGSTQFLTSKKRGISFAGNFVQLTTDAGEYLGNEPYTDMPAAARAAAEAQTALAAEYNAKEHRYYGIAGVDWFLTQDGDGRMQVSVGELNSRPTANTPPIIISQKRGAQHFINTNVYTDTPIGSIDDFVHTVGEDLAYGDPHKKGMVVPQAFRSIARGGSVEASPHFKVAVLGRDAAHCRAVLRTLGNMGVRFEP
jgi:hypothetical protein